MASSKLSISGLFILFIAFSIHQVAAGAGVDLLERLGNVCSTWDNFTSGSEYEKPLELILSHVSQEIGPMGYYAEALPVTTTDFIYSLGQCRGDISVSDCKTCIAEAGKWIRENCPVSNQAIAWYEGCLLKYSNNNFVGKVDNQRYYIDKSERSKSSPASVQIVQEFLSVLSERAYASNKKFANGEVKLTLAGSSENLYGLVQCTLDLSSENCKACIDGMIRQVPNYFAKGKGGQFVSGTCTLQYEFYPFFNV